MAEARRSLLANLGLATFLLGIVVSWFWKAPPSSDLQLALMPLVLITAVLALVALLRPPARKRDERWWVYALCLLSVVYVHGYRLDASPGSFLYVVFWGRVCLQFLANVALLSLGRSYAMLPALREVRTGFLYGYVRHPVYALYMLADLGIVLLDPSPRNAAVAAVGAVAFMLRSRLEERVLGQDPAYQSYMRLVRWRFVPGVH